MNRALTSRQSVSNRPSNAEPAAINSTTGPRTNFVADFMKFCKDNEAYPLPQFQIIGSTESFKIISANSTTDLCQNKSDVPEITNNQKSKTQGIVFQLIYDNLIDLDAPVDLRCKGCEVDVLLLKALNVCTRKFYTLTTLKLQRCVLPALGIVQISEILGESGCRIKDLNVDSNPNIQQNYHLLCSPGIRLLYLSLKLCGINDECAERIASNLMHQDEPHTPKLIALNLSNNHISEIGAKAFADMLRTNRSLQSLTLAGNRIKDVGAESILEQLTTFALRQNEVQENRRRKIRRLKLGVEKVKNVSSQALMVHDSVNTLESWKQRERESRVSKKRRASSRQKISTSNLSESSINRSNPIIVQSLEEQGNAIIPADTHPLVHNVIRVNGTLMCPGNMELQHLNLNFCKISEDTLRQVIKCVQKQQSTMMTSNTTKGLLHVNVEGNDFEESSDMALQFIATMNQRRNLIRNSVHGEK